MDGKSLDITAMQREKLKEVFPEAVSEEKIDWEKLRLALGDEVVIANERYVLNWAGKSDAFRAIQTQTTATLKPQKAQSVNFDTTNNIFIEGENLEVLKVLQKSYYGKIKMIYIDPPYNTGNDSFVYPDKFSESKDEYLKRIGDKDEEGYLTKEGFFRKNSKENGQFHSNWLSMMYPRLFLARNLLKDDGVIFVSINDNEVHNLRLMMNEIFGEENFVGQVTWKARVKPVNIGDSRYRPQREIEYVLIYEKSEEEGKFKPLITGGVRTYPYDLKGRKYRLTTILKSNRGVNYRSTMTFELDGYVPPEGQRWQAGEDVIKLWKKDGYIEFKDGTPFRRYFEDEEGAEHDPFYCFMEVDWSSTSESGKLQLSDLLGENHGFDTVKPTRLIETLLQSCTDDHDIILDFFAGSGTTAHTVLELNRKDSGNRKFILVQLGEKIDTESEASKAGYNSIADICRERMRRIGKTISEEIESNPNLFENGKLDLGFKAFNLEPSNFKVWRTDIIENEGDLKKQMEAFVDPARIRSEAENMAWEILLKTGYELTTPVEQITIADVSVYSISGEVLLALEKITQKAIDAIIAKKPKRVICLDRLFAGNDQLKTNTALQMKDAGVEFRTI